MAHAVFCDNRRSLINKLNMDLIETLVTQALIHSENAHIQKQAENQIFNLFSSNPTQFFLCCAQIMANDKK